MLTDHVLGIDAWVTKCYETLASDSSTASSSVAANIVQELEDKKPQELEDKKNRKNNMLFFFDSPEPDALNSEADLNYASKLCKDTHLILTFRF